MIDGAVGSYFSDHFTRQLKAASMVQDYLDSVQSRLNESKAEERQAGSVSSQRGKRWHRAHELLPGLRV